ncbi:MAG: acetyltransferase [Actinomycetota bacterium]
MSTQRYLIACGGHGRVVLDALLASGNTVNGIIDAQLEVGSLIFGIPVVGNDDLIKTLDPKKTELINGLGSTKSTQARQEIYNGWLNLGFKFIGVQHPSATIGSECQVCESTQIMAGAVLQNRVCVGENVVINTRASVDHDVVISDHCVISPGAIISGSVKIGRGSFIGAGAVVIQGIEIGDNCVIGAGAVVRHNVKDSAIVVGNPAKQLDN